MSVLGPIFKMVNSLLPEKPALKEGYSEEWYFSPEGKNAYESLSTPCEKTKFFLNHLRSIEQKTNDSSSVDLLYKIAFVMSNSMVDSQLAFGGYPNILDATKNPFIGYVKSNAIRYYSNDDKIYCLEFLRLLHYGPCSNKDESDLPYGLISFCGDNEIPSDIYKIERDIMSVFGFSWLSLDRKLPYGYSFTLDYVVRNGNKSEFKNEIKWKDEIEVIEEEINNEDERGEQIDD